MISGEFSLNKMSERSLVFGYLGLFYQASIQTPALMKDIRL
jgi:hypothetical protein